MKIAFIGGGNMGEAMLSAVLSNGVAAAASISVSDIAEARRRYLNEKYGVSVTAGNLEAVSGADVVVLAIKPQNLAEVAAEIGGKLKADQLVLSIIAGKKIKTLKKGLRHEAIVRAMPNTPAQVGQGITVWAATPEVTEQQKGQATAILGAMGEEIFTADEEYLNMATAVSGSGPAYVFLFMESLAQAAVDIGLPPDMAAELVLKTVLGSADFARQSDKSLADLRKMVTSPGGTTAAALKAFEEGSFKGLVKKAVMAAYRRARELGG